MERGCCTLLAIFPALLSLAVFIGGTQRMPLPNYEALLNFSGGESWPYGVAWLSCAVMMILGNEKVRIGGLALVVLVSNLWAGLFLKSALDSPTAALTPTSAYAGYGVLVAAMLSLILIHRKRRVNDGAL